MSIDPNLLRIIRNEVRKQVNIILTGVAGETDQTEHRQDIEQLYPGSDTITQRPIAHPYGFVSVAPPGTMQVVGRQGDHPSNRIVLLHRDADRPADLEDGSAKMYSIAGYQVYVSTDGIFIGKDSADEPLVLGNTALEFLGALLDLLVAHVHPSPGAPSDKSADFVQLKTEFIDSKALVSSSDGGLP